MIAYRRTAAAFAATMILAAVLALLVDDVRWDTVLGGVAGASTALLLGCIVGIALERRRRRDEADDDSLNRLEPLRAARRDRA